MDIAAWLDSLGLGEYGPAFAENRIEGDVLRDLTDRDLVDLGVTALGDRKRLLAAIAELEIDSSAAEPPATPSLEGERRQVTVLFADISGFTALSERLGAEATHNILNRFFEAADSIVEEFGGSIDKHIGDNLMAVFGAPIAHGNDPERAIRAALSIHDAARKIETPAGALRLHIGVASGQVVASGTGSDAYREYTVTGEAVNLAARLQDLARPGQTLVSEAVYSHVSAVVTGGVLKARPLKGITHPMAVYRVDGLSAASEPRRSTPFVGRRSELSQCSAILSQVIKTGCGQALLLRGTAGIGKTRVAEVIMEEARNSGYACHRILVLDFGSLKGEMTLPALARSLLGLQGTTTKDARRAAARNVLSTGAVSGDAEAFLNDLLDLPQPMRLRRIYDAMDDRGRREGRQALIANLTIAEARRQPQMIVVEDLHWADLETLDMLAALVRATQDVPVFIVGTSRPDSDPSDGTWRTLGFDLPVSVIHLGPLRASEARKMAEGLAPEKEHWIAECLKRADGNPLFLEQLLQNPSEASAAVPGSISSLVLARLDRLVARDRRALQAASVFGQRFETAALRHLIEDPLYEPAALKMPELLRPEGEHFLFAHALIRDGVYGSILTTTRDRLHLRAAEWFARRDPTLHAQHLELAGDPRAAVAYLEAARLEMARYHYDRSITLLRKGKSVAKSKTDLAALAMAFGEAALDIGAAEESRSAFEDVLATTPDDVVRCRAYLGLAGVKRLTDEHDAAMKDLDAALALADRLSLIEEAARAHFIRGNLLFPVGDAEGCVREHGEALALAREAGSAELEAEALGGLGDAEYIRGRFSSALQRFTECVELSRAHGFGRIEVANLPMVAFCAMFCGEMRRAKDVALASVEAARRVGHERAEMIGHHSAFMYFKASAELELAREHAERAIEIARRLRTSRFEAEGQGFLAEVEYMAGDRLAALDRIRHAVTTTRAVGMSYIGPMILGQLAVITDDEVERSAALAEGEALLAEGSVGHNHIFFRWNAMDACLRGGDFDEAERHADELAAFCPEPEMRRIVFAAACGRALAQVGRGERNMALAAEIDRLIVDGERMDQELALRPLRQARKTLAA